MGVFEYLDHVNFKEGLVYLQQDFKENKDRMEKIS